MRILVTNDDGILSEGLWKLVEELKGIGQVTVVTPDREQSAIGTAVSLRQPLRIQKIKSQVPEVEAYSVDGTPSDSVILALGTLTRDKVDMVVSGINHGFNLGEDFLISGTVSAALQGYLRGLPALAISSPDGNDRRLDAAAKVAAILVKKLAITPTPTNLLLNVNLPHLPLREINGVKITRFARESHINTVEEGNHGQQKYFWMVRQRTAKANDNNTDIGAIEQGYVSITPLYFDQADRPPKYILKELCTNLFEQLKTG